MKYFVLLFISLSLISIEASELSLAINNTLKNFDGNKDDLRPKLLQIEILLKGNSIKNPHAVFLTEFLNFTLKNPTNKSFNRYSYTKSTIENDIRTIENKMKFVNPLAKFLAKRVINEVKALSQQKAFKDYLNVVKKSYYFSSKELKIIDKKLRFLEPWWKLYVNTSHTDLNNTFNQHMIKFLYHFAHSAEFILNRKIIIEPKGKLTIFTAINNIDPEISVEKKLTKIVQEYAKSSQKEKKEQLDEPPEWTPKNSSKNELSKFINLNSPLNYPKPSPNYTAPRLLPIPMNDW